MGGRKGRIIGRDGGGSRKGIGKEARRSRDIFDVRTGGKR